MALIDSVRVGPRKAGWAGQDEDAHRRAVAKTHAYIEQEEWEDQDPNNLILTYTGPAARYAEGQYDEAIREARGWLQMYVDCYYWLGRASIEKHDYATAIEALQKAQEHWHPTDMLGQLGRAYALQGDHARALEVVRQMDRMAKADQYVQPYCAAWVYAALGQTNQALAALEQAVADRSWFLMDVGPGGLRTDPAWDGLRDEPRFQALLKTVGLDVWPR